MGDSAAAHLEPLGCLCERHENVYCLGNGITGASGLRILSLCCHGLAGVVKSMLAAISSHGMHGLHHICLYGIHLGCSNVGGLVLTSPIHIFASLRVSRNERVQVVEPLMLDLLGSCEQSISCKLIWTPIFPKFVHSFPPRIDEPNNCGRRSDVVNNHVRWWGVARSISNQ